MNAVTDTFGAMGFSVLEMLITAMAPAIIAWLGVKLNRLFNTIEVKTGLVIETVHREALHSAVTTAVTSLISGATEATSVAATPGTKVSDALSYVKKSVPDAIKALGATDDILIDMVKSKFNQMFGD